MLKTALSPILAYFHPTLCMIDTTKLSQMWNLNIWLSLNKDLLNVFPNLEVLNVC